MRFVCVIWIVEVLMGFEWNLLFLVRGRKMDFDEGR
jgi:hypothetical protein